MRIVASASACSGTKMNPNEKPCRKRGQARLQKSIVAVRWVISASDAACSRQPKASISRWSTRETSRPEIMSAIIVPSPPGASVSPAVHAS